MRLVRCDSGAGQVTRGGCRGCGGGTSCDGDWHEGNIALGIIRRRCSRKIGTSATHHLRADGSCRATHRAHNAAPAIGHYELQT